MLKAVPDELLKPEPASLVGRDQERGMTMEDRLERIESMLSTLVERQIVKDWYDVDEFARLVGKAPFTVREWCRLGRISAEKRKSGRGPHAAWVICHAELQRYQRDGLLPL